MTNQRNNSSQLARPPEVVQKTALIVLGMHRSGTSAFTRLISLLGADLPGNLINPVPENNQKGFWESLDILDLNDDLLRALDSSWDDWRQLDTGRLSIPLAAELKSRAIGILLGNFANSALFVLKDPRFCRFLPFWLDAIDRFGAKPVCILTVRNPIEVAASLYKRDGFSPEKSYLLWLRHNLEAELSSRSLRRRVLLFENLIEDWHSAVDKIYSIPKVAWPILSKNTEAAISNFLDKSQYHHRSNIVELNHNPDISPLIQKAYCTLTVLSENPESESALASLDEIREQFNGSTKLFGSVLWQEKVAAELSNRQREEAEHLRQSLEDRYELLLDAQNGIAVEVASLRGELSEKSIESESLQKKLTAESESLRQMKLREGQTLRKVMEAVRERDALAYALDAIHTRSWKLYFLPPIRWHYNQTVRKITKYGLFDGPWYLARNPDVAQAGVNPLAHYIASGASEGRAPHPPLQQRLVPRTKPRCGTSRRKPPHSLHRFRSIGRTGATPPLRQRLVPRTIPRRGTDRRKSPRTLHRFRRIGRTGATPPLRQRLVPRTIPRRGTDRRKPPRTLHRFRRIGRTGATPPLRQRLVPRTIPRRGTGRHKPPRTLHRFRSICNE